MKTSIVYRLSITIFTLAGIAAALNSSPSAATRKFYDDDPIWIERDTQDASRIRPWKLDVPVDVAMNLLIELGDPTPNVRARNVNTVDEVPDSSWFTNRIGRLPLTAADVAKGPDVTPGPLPGRWTVTSSKTDGVSPGFTITDSARQLWFLKFDPLGYRGLGTGSEMVSTKLLWALGYHVPESHIAYLHPEQLAIGEGAKYEPPGGKKRPMQLSDIAKLLKGVDREPDGSYRVIAGRALPKVGEFRFYGTNPDDPNDVVPHEHRRELRGYRVFAAWLNHVDSHAHNTLDALIKENGRAFVRHYLQDFSSTLGAASNGPREYWEGYEYLLEGRESLRQIPAFGFYIPEWHTVDTYEAKSVGRLPQDNTRFDPDRWKPRVPIQAFLRARADDKFWAARKLSAITDDMLRAAVRAAQLGDPESEQVLVKMLAERRDAIARSYLTAINPITDPVLGATGVLTFRNAAVDGGFAHAPATYHARWFNFDNATGRSESVGESSATAPRLQAPPDLLRRGGVFIKVEVTAIDQAQPSWQVPVHAYFRRDAGTWRLVGFERTPEP